MFPFRRLDLPRVFGFLRKGGSGLWGGVPTCQGVARFAISFLLGLGKENAFPKSFSGGSKPNHFQLIGIRF